MKRTFSGLSTASTSTQLPNGNYSFEIDFVDPEYKSMEKQSEALEVKCHVIEGMDFDDGSSTVGLQRTIRFWYPHAGQKDKGKFCKGRLNEFLKSAGIDTSNDDYDDDDLVGAKFTCRCRIKTDKSDNENEEFDKYVVYE